MQRLTRVSKENASGNSLTAAAKNASGSQPSVGGGPQVQPSVGWSSYLHYANLKMNDKPLAARQSGANDLPRRIIT